MNADSIGEFYFLKDIVALVAISFCSIASGLQEDEKYERAFRETQLQNYRKILDRYDVDSTAIGACQYLKNFLPNAETETLIREQIERLKSKRFRDREAAENRLATLGPAAINFLSAAVLNGDPETKMRASRAVSVINSYSYSLTRAAVNILKLDAAESPNTQERLELFFDLCRHGMANEFETELSTSIVHCASREVRQTIIHGIEDGHSLVRLSCIKALPHCVSRNELNEFSELLESDEPDLSMAAIESFGFIAPTHSVNQAIENHLNSAAPHIRRSAINFLRAISMEHFGYVVDGTPPQRDAAIDQWKSWLNENRPISAESFERMEAKHNRLPTGLLISVNGKGVRSYDLDGKLIWKLDGQAYDAQYVTPQVHLITFRSSGEVKMFRKDKVIQTVSGLNSPSDADYLANGNVLIAHGSGLVTEHDSTGKIIRRFEGYANPFDVDRLANGNTLIADSSNNRIVEIDTTGMIVWKSEDLKFPNNVFRLPDGRTLYTTYTSGLIGIVGVDGKKLWETKIENATLYSVYGAQGKIFASDGANRKVWILNLAGEITGQISVPETFCDINFITK